MYSDSLTATQNTNQVNKVNKSHCKLMIAILVFLSINLIIANTFLTSYTTVNKFAFNINKSNTSSIVTWQQYITKPNEENIEFKSGKTGGEWSMCAHFRDRRHEKFDIDLAHFIAYKFRPRNAIDFGSGLGLYIDFMAQFYYKFDNQYNTIPYNANNGLFIAIEPENMMSAGIYGKYSLQLALNMANNNTQQLQHIISSIPKVDIVTSFEVLEHVPFIYHQTIIDLLVSRCKKYLIFSAAHPRQLGNGHLEESMFTKTEWIKTFENKSMIHLPQLSHIITHKFARLSWFRSNVFVMANAQFINDTYNGIIDSIDQCDEECVQQIGNSKLQIINDAKQKIMDVDMNKQYSTRQNLIFVTRHIWPIYWSRFTNSSLCKQ